MTDEATGASVDERIQSQGDGSPPAGRRSLTAPIAAIAARELRSTMRSTGGLLFAAALSVAIVGVAYAGGGYRSSYLATSVDLLAALEVLLPVVAVAFGYRTLLSDARSGELDVLLTYPVAAWQHVLGAYLGRAIPLSAVVLVPFLAVAGLVSVSTAPEASVFATHAGADSPILFARLAALSLLYALVALSVGVAVSAVATSARVGIALSVGAVVGIVLVADLAIVGGLASGAIGGESIHATLALSPASAFRGLVFETVISVAGGAGPETASTTASLTGLSAWLVGSLAVAVVALRLR
ncbi:ABC transporter permease [Halalkaliarchaeum desulfuricum]|uniref:ABC transporter permease n=1 Tax=Halalkaliarchaeum desulfuricum TaxID=2055893 RepID=A0A343TF86_9EURY|nr:ABC transporter permease subunit [Halalkaliarchaeum desulfuricum]AUX07758.1 ABC transporter permease [Halalkaliarchaeum desulfuricum]